MPTPAPAPSVAPGPQIDAAPPRLGRYDFARSNRKLGEGGMGQVWLAWHDVLGLERAVKVPSVRFTRDPNWRLDMVREARMLANLSHPAIARFYEFVEDGERCGVVMEYVSGRTLRAELNRRRALPLADALRIARVIADALDTAHRSALRIVHCDLKPGNIMLTESGEVKILDWGIARREAAEESAAPSSESIRLTVEVHADEERGRFGTVGYVPPEAILGQTKASRATDIFAFGAVLFEMLTGERAFPGATVDEKLSRTLRGEVDWSLLPGDLPGHVSGLLHRLLAPDPRLRLADIGDALPELTIDAPMRSRRGRIRNNIPAPGSNFIGRRRELAELRGTLGERRLVVLRGLGGVGKSALSLELAHDLIDDRLVAASGLFRDGVWLVRLGSISDGALLPETISSALSLGGSIDAEQLVDRLAEFHALLILDRCEHLAGPVARLAEELLPGCPDLRILVTTRCGLPARSAAQIHLGPLPTTRGAGRLEPRDARELDAVQLFLQRAQGPFRGFTPTDREIGTILDICSRLDGVPLSIEIAAGFTSHWDLETLLQQLDCVLATPVDRARAGASAAAANRATLNEAGSVEARSEDAQRDAGTLPGGDSTLESGVEIAVDSALESMVAWSVERLDPPRRELLDRLSVFRDGWTLQDARAVCGCADRPGLAPERIPILLSELVDAALVEFERPDGSARYRMLSPVRRLVEAGFERSAAESPRDSEGSAATALSRLRPAADCIRTLDDARERHRTHFLSLPRCVAEGPSLRHAASSSLHGRLEPLVHEWGNLRAAMAATLASSSDDGRRAEAAAFAIDLHRFLLARGLHREGLAMLDQVIACCCMPAASSGAASESERERAGALMRARLLNAAGILAWQALDLDRAERHCLDAISILEEMGMQDERIARVQINLGLVHKERAAPDPAIRCFDTACAIGARIGSTAVMAEARLNSGATLLEAGRLNDAAESLDQAIAALSPLTEHEEFLAEGLHLRARIDVERGSIRTAAQLLIRALGSFRELGNLTRLCLASRTVARLAQSVGALDDATVLLVGSSTMSRSMDVRLRYPTARDEAAILEHARQMLGEAGFAEALRRGESIDPAGLFELAERVSRRISTLGTGLV